MDERIPMFYPFVSEEAVGAAVEALKSRFVGQGPKVDEFEKALKAKLETPYVVTVNSGTSALRLALSIMGVGPGDEVISPAFTSQATNMPILEQFAKPVFADVKYESGAIDPKDIEHRITPKTKGIIAVDWGGAPCDMDEIMRIAKAHRISVIEDAAHSLGARYKGKAVGAISDFTAFSFQAIKQLTTTDGGALTTANQALYERAMSKRWYAIDKSKRKFSYLGNDPDFDITEVGFKYNMTDVEANIGIAQLKHLDELLARRAAVAKRYMEELARVPQIELFESRTDRVSANWLFGLHVKKNRLGFAKKMYESGIEVSIVNWRNDKYTAFGGMRKDLPNTDRLHEDYIAIPLHHRLSDDDVSRIIRTVKASVS